MQDKKSFGRYIADKRKEANLTQEELAKRLYVIPTTISKWERGVTYPDITAITNLCKELNITEHEFFMACDDEAMNKEKKEIQTYKRLKKWLFNMINIGYIIAIFPCLICNLVIDKKLSWFWIVLIGILISFSITTLPHYLKNNKYKVLKVTSVVTTLVYLLLFVINCVNHENWLLESYIIATVALIFLWIDILICVFTKITVYTKIAISLIMISLAAIFANFICTEVLNIPNNDSNFPNIICSILMIVIALIIIVKEKKNRKN